MRARRPNTRTHTHNGSHVDARLPEPATLAISHSLFSAVACFEVIFYELLVQIYGLISFGTFMRGSALHVLHCEVQK